MRARTSSGRARAAWARSSLAIITVVSGWATPASADDTHYQDFLVGGRAIGLGGAFSAISDDPSGVYFNPAGLADARSADLQVSTSLYGFERGSIDSGLTLPVPGIEQRNIQFTDLVIIPASAGFVKTFGPLDAEHNPYQAYALSVLVPSYRSFKVSFDDEKDGYEASYQRRVTDRELWSGVGYGRRFGDRLRLGVSGYYILRSVVDAESVTLRERQPSGEDKFQAVTNDISLLNGSVLLLAGAKLQLGDLVSMGLTLQSPSLRVHSQADLRFSRASADPTAAGGPQASLDVINPPGAECDTRQAAAARLGVALSRKYKYTLSLDVSYHAPVDYTLITVDSSYRRFLPFAPAVHRNGVVNFNVGGEYLIVREVSVAAGFFSDFSSAPAIPNYPTQDQPAQVDLFGMSASLGYFSTHTLSRIGLVYSFGHGYEVIPASGDIDRVINNDQSFSRVKYFQSFFYLFLSSTFRY